MAGRGLNQVDAMRPIKQAGVISTHSVLYFAPAAASVGSGAALLLLHVSREGFFFISACMLTYAYAYADLGVGGLRPFITAAGVLSVVIPLPVLDGHLLPPTCCRRRTTWAWAHALRQLASMAYTGYYQLYFLLVIMQFYLVFPLVLMLLRRTRGHHGRLIAAAAQAQVAIAIGMHWQILPPLMIRYGQQDALSYLLYLIGGGVVAFHLDEVHAWVCGHARLRIVALTVARDITAEGRSIPGPARRDHRARIGQSALPAQRYPVQRRRDHVRVPGRVALVRPWRSRRTRAIVCSGSDNAYGIYLTQMLFITALVWLGWGHLTSMIPWPLLCLLTVGIVFTCGVALTSVLARTPLAIPLTGRKQQPWSTLIPRRGAPDQIYAERAPSEQARTDQAPTGHTAMAGATSDQNGARQ